MKRLALILLLAACAPDHPSARYLTVGQVAQPINFASLQGTWHEVAFFPSGLTDGCVGTTATFSAPTPEGVMSIAQACQRDGHAVQFPGAGVIRGPGQLRVTGVNGPLTGDLLILGQADGGRTVFLGTQSRVTGFVLHRDRTISPETIDRAEEVYRANGYDVAALQRTLQR
jgi:apolipoprotein D and lipocalin family protein